MAPLQVALRSLVTFLWVLLGVLAMQPKSVGVWGTRRTFHQRITFIATG